MVMEGGVFAVSVIVGFDEVEDSGPSVMLVDEAAALEHLGFESVHKEFELGVMVGIGSGGHALERASLGEQ